MKLVRKAVLVLIASAMAVTITLSGVTTDNTVRAQIADTPWPMFHHDPQHTGRSPYTGPQVPEEKWKFGGVNGWCSPAIGDNGTTYVGGTGFKLYAVNPDGTEKWRFSTSGQVFSSLAIGDDGTIYVGSGSSANKLYAINPDGSLQWSFSTSGEVLSSPAVSSNGTVYVGSRDKKLYAVDPDGSLKWSFTTGDDVDSSPAIGSDNTVYVGSDDKKLYAINPDGSLKWSFVTGGDISSSPAIGADGTVYVGSHDNELYAINPEARGGWSSPHLQAEPYEYTLGLAQAAEKMGTSIRQGDVVGFRHKGSRVTSIIFASGTEVEAGIVVLATGAWSGLCSHLWNRSLVDAAYLS